MAKRSLLSRCPSYIQHMQSNTYRFSTATVVTRTRLNVSLCVHWHVSNIFKLGLDGEVMLNIYVKESIITMIIVIVLIDNTS